VYSTADDPAALVGGFEEARAGAEKERERDKGCTVGAGAW
jgi:hypothetical protein